MKNSKSKIIFIRANSFGSEPRLIKCYSVAKAQSNEVKLLLWNLGRSPKKENDDIIYFQLKPKYGSFWLKPIYLIWVLFCLSKLFLLRPKLIHSCDLEGGLIALVYHFFFPKTKIVYDLYDVTAAKYDLPFDSPKRKKLLHFERNVIKHFDELLIPDTARLDQLQFTSEEKKKVSFSVVYNTEIFSEIKNKKDIEFKKNLNIVYIGIMSSKIRGLEHIVSAAKECPDFNFLIAGFGPDQEMIEKSIEESQASNIKFLGRVTYSKARELFDQSDLIISLLDPTFNNYKFASSTKVFDAFSAQKPIITTQGTVSGEIVEKAQWGYAVNYEASDLIRLLKSLPGKKLSLDPTLVSKYDWRNSAAVLDAIYRRYL